MNTKTYLCVGIIILFFAFNAGLVINSFGFSGAHFKCCTELNLEDNKQSCLSDDPQSCQGEGYCGPGWDLTEWGECDGPWSAWCCLDVECSAPDHFYLASYCLIPPK